MKTKLLLIFLLLTGIAAFGQTKKTLFGASISADWNSYLFVQDKGAMDYRGRPNLSAGAILWYNLSTHFSLDGGLYFSTKNYKEKIDFSKYYAITPGDPVLTQNKNARILHNQQFLDIPISLNYHFIRKASTDFYTSIGVVGSALLTHQHKSSSKDINNLSDNTAYNNFLGSIKIGVGACIKTENLGINIEPQFRWFVTDVHKSEIKGNPVHFGIQVFLLKL